MRNLILLAAYTAIATLRPGPAQATDAAAVARIHGGIVDCVACDLSGTDLTGAKTSITSFLGTDLRHVMGLTQAQLDIACGDGETLLPPGLKIHTCR